MSKSRIERALHCQGSQAVPDSDPMWIGVPFYGWIIRDRIMLIRQSEWGAFCLKLAAAVDRRNERGKARLKPRTEETKEPSA